MSAPRSGCCRDGIHNMAATTLLKPSVSRDSMARVRQRRQDESILDPFVQQARLPLSDLEAAQHARSFVRWSCLMGRAEAWHKVATPTQNSLETRASHHPTSHPPNHLTFFSLHPPLSRFLSPFPSPPSRVTLLLLARLHTTISATEHYCTVLDALNAYRKVTWKH